MQHMGYLPVGKSFFFGFAHKLGWNIAQIKFLNFIFHLDEFFNLFQEPFINLSHFVNRAEWNTNFERVMDMKQPVPSRVGQTIHQLVLVSQLFAISAQSISPYL